MPTEPIGAADFKLLRDFIERECGIVLGEEKAYLIETRLAGLMVETGAADYGAFYRLAMGGTPPDLRDRIIDAMTTNETLWFRDGHPFGIFREKLLPKLAEELLAGRRFRIRIWSAASSTGQEPYSLAMEVLDFCARTPGLKPEQFEILATDISPSALFFAKAGRYDAAAISRGLPLDKRDRYFTQQGQVWSLKEEVKRLVTFRKFNLQDSLAAMGRMEIIFCRYVTIYFAEDFKERIYREIADLLSPDGYLVISAVENLLSLADRFTPLSHAGGTYYQCKAPE